MTDTPKPSIAPNPADAAIETQLANMSLEEKVGQVMIVGFDGIAMTDELRADIAKLHLGGLIIFERNVDTPVNLAQLIGDAQTVAHANGDPPLLVAIDQEGGTVARLKETKGYTEFPSMMAVAASGDVNNARRIAAVAASELKAVGINVNFAPVLDVNSNARNPVIAQRSFGSDPRRVAEFGAAYIDGLQAAGILAVGKHFPGHGDTSIDSHDNMPSLPHGRSRLDAVELVPFKAAMRAGVAGLMSAHVTYPEIDSKSGLPGTLSPKIMTGLVRDELDFDGLLFTDALEMGALGANNYPPPLAGAMALRAGADVLTFNRGYSLHRDAHRLIVDWVSRGDIPIQRLNDAVRRVLAAKARVAANAVLPRPSVKSVGSPENKAVVRDVARQAVTLARDDANLVPIPSDKKVLVIEASSAAGLGRAVAAARSGDTETFSIADRPRASDIRSAVAAAKRSQIVVVATSDVAKNPQQAELVNALTDASLPVVIVASRSPYDSMQFERSPTYLATYGSSPLMFWALSEVLAGKTKPIGKLPVEI